jgi:hypothetical protein
VAGTLTAAPAAPALPAGAAASDRPTARAQAATDWLADQLTPGDLVQSGYESQGTWVTYIDHGLTLDVFFAFKDLGVKRKLREGILDALETRVDDYVSPGTQTYAGSLGKLLTAVQRQHRAVAHYEDGDLLTRLQRMVHRGGDADGLAQAANAPGTTNTIGQSFVVQALAMAGSDLADETTRFLLRQQCDNGYFRVYTKSPDRSCDSGTAAQSGPSVDATALAVQALRVAEKRHVAVRKARLAAALQAAEAWLVRKQRDSGAFREDGIANANSTGLAAAALARLGRSGRADDAARWLRGRQVTRALAHDGALGGERGAVAFDRAAFHDAVNNGITRDVRYQWRRATAQAAAGLDVLHRR